MMWRYSGMTKRFRNLSKSHYARMTFLAAVLASRAAASGHADEKRPVAVVEIGGAGEWGLSGGSSFGPSGAVEVTPIEHWLELEAGVTPLFSRDQSEWDTDLLFKKPYTLSKTAEFMCGVGPEWAHVSANGKSSNSITGEAVLDFMFWPKPKRKFGWYLEPSYGYSFARGHEQSMGVNGGLLIAIR